MGRIIPLAAYSRNGQKYAKPRIVYLNEDHIIEIVSGSKATALTKVVTRKDSVQETFLVHEKAFEIEVQRNPSTTDLIIKQCVTVGITPAGSVQGGTALSTYFNEATTLGAGATDAVTLMAGVKNKAVFVANNDASGDPLEIFPFTGEKINNGAANAKLVGDLASKKRTTLVYSTGDLYPGYVNTWVVADDFGK